jgi:hypothetical protein
VGEVKMKRKTAVAIVVIGLLLTSAASQTTQPKPAPAVPVATIPFELGSRHIFLKIKINDSRPLSFVFDTGDKFAIVDLARAKELGLKLGSEIRVGGAGGGMLTGAMIQGSAVAIPGLDGFAQPVVLAIPLGELATQMGRDFDGIIGSDFIKQYVVEVDYQARVLRLYDKDKFSYAGPGESIPIKLNAQGHPTLDAEVTPQGSDPIKGRFVLDLGSGGSLVLHSPTVAEHHLLNANLKTIKTLGGGGAGGEVTGQIGRVSELKIGTYRIKSPVTLFSEDKAGALADTVLLGNIGEQIASKFKVFLDYSHERIILEPNATFAEPFDRSSGGMHIVAQGNDYKTFRIKNILDSSPASEAGLQKEDVITAVDGKPAAQLSLSELLEMFERPVAYRLTIRRGEQALQVTLTPRKLV